MTARWETVREVDAPVERVWAVLADRDRYGEWNPFLRRLRGATDPGATWFANVKPPRARGMLFRPRLVTWDPPRSLAFRGQLGVPGVFDGLYRFEVEPVSDGRSRVRASLTFGGWLVPWLAWKAGPHMGDGLEGMVEPWCARVMPDPDGGARPR